MITTRTRARLRGGLTAVVVLACACNANAQRAGENAVAEASDAFGTAVGREEIGLYSSTSVRGFSPSQAGNLRIDGLYFDQISQAKPVSRIVRSSSVHVGISAQGFPFPAPTGVGDFHLRVPGDTAAGGVLLGVASYDQAYGEFDFQTPLVKDVLSVGAGVGYSRNSSYKIADQSGEWTAGGIARWQPTAALTIVPFWGMTRHREYDEKPYVFIGNSGYPEYRGVDLMAQPWTDYGMSSSNFGATAHLALAADWQIDAGAFRSQASTPINYEPFLFDTDSLGQGDYSISASPPRTARSTSGEIRLSKKFATESVRNTVYLSLKGRQRSDESGGADSIDLGPATTRWVPQIEKPVFNPGPTTRVEARQLTPGLAYEGLWRDVGQLSLGLQKSYYDRTIAVPGAPSISGSSSPWLYNFGTAAFLTKKLIAYASYTRGFEEIGNAPLNAANRDETVPAQLTQQVDAGIKYQLSSRLQLVAGVFEIKKPYFDLDQTRIFRRVGSTSNRGIELSLTGGLTDNLTVVAGVILIDPKVQYDNDANSESASTLAIGPIPGLIRANFQYRVARVHGLTLDAKIERTSDRYARADTIRLPAVTTIDGGVRYDTQLLGRNATWRLQALNLTNEFGLTPSASGQLTPFDSRRFDLSLAFDI
ncbi:MAG TPA: hypothetical protein VGN07_16990 [Steroidobacteraceae bacterium]